MLSIFHVALLLLSPPLLFVFLARARGVLALSAVCPLAPATPDAEDDCRLRNSPLLTQSRREEKRRGRAARCGR